MNISGINNSGLKPDVCNGLGKWGNTDSKKGINGLEPEDPGFFHGIDMPVDKSVKNITVFHDDLVSRISFTDEGTTEVTTTQAPEPVPLSADPPMKLSRMENGQWIADDGAWKGKKIALMVHGINGWSPHFTKMGGFLEKNHGYDGIYAVDYKLGYFIDDLGKKLAELIKEKAPEGEKIHVFAHSMGGLVARSALENHGADRQADMLVTMGTPHNGVKAAMFIDNLLPVNLPEIRDMKPGSDFLKNLNDGKPVDVDYFSAIGTDGKNLTKYWTIKFLGEDRIARLLDDPLNDGMVPAKSASYDLTKECKSWDSRTFTVSHKYVRGGNEKDGDYKEIFHQIDRWLALKENKG